MTTMTNTSKKHKSAIATLFSMISGETSAEDVSKKSGQEQGAPRNTRERYDVGTWPIIMR